MDDEHNWTEADDYTDDGAPDDEQAYEDDLAAQNAVEDAKYDAMFPPQEEPDDWQQGTATEYQRAQELLAEAEDAHKRGDDECFALDAAQVHATLAMADQLADVLSLLKQERNRESYAERVAREAIVELDAKRKALGTIWQVRGPLDGAFYMTRDAAENAAVAGCLQDHPNRAVEWHTDSGGRSWTLCFADGVATAWDLLMHEVRESSSVRADVYCPF